MMTQVILLAAEVFLLLLSPSNFKKMYSIFLFIYQTLIACIGPFQALLYLIRFLFNFYFYFSRQMSKQRVGSKLGWTCSSEIKDLRLASLLEDL